MNWQIFLTTWIILQVIIKTARQPKFNRLEGKSEAELVGAIIGTILWGLGMLACLYFGGFYGTRT